MLLLAAVPGSAQVPADAAELEAWLGGEQPAHRTWQALAAHARTEDSDVRRVLTENLLRWIPSRDLETELEETPGVADVVLPFLSRSLTESSTELSRRIRGYVADAARSRSDRLAAGRGEWSPDELQSLLTLQFVEPSRFVTDESFRPPVVEILVRAMGARAPRELKDLLLYSINNVPGVDFETSERIELAWGVAPRRSAERETEYAPGRFAFPGSETDPVVASIFSLPSTFVSGAEASRFLERVRAIAPHRTMLVLVDLPLRMELADVARRLDVSLLETHGRAYSAWPRDPFSLVRAADGAVVLVLRPNSQEGRSEDNFLGLELVQGLPASIDRQWGEVRWARSPIPFHNGHVLLTRDKAWISLHSVELRALELLGLARVPVEEFGERERWRSYVRAARQAGRELETLYGREVAFVHALAENEPADEMASAVAAIGGGAGFDLDSLVTVLETRDGSVTALVGDVDGGRELLESADADALAEFGRAFGLDSSGDSLRRALVASQRTARARGLDAFLEHTSRSLGERGIDVRRLPLFFVPVRLLSNRGDFNHEDFLITWNNVVAERRDEIFRAEGFAQRLAPGDARARAVFDDVGYRLELVPPLVRSIVLEGGYRCASQHLRASRGR